MCQHSHLSSARWTRARDVEHTIFLDCRSVPYWVSVPEGNAGALCFLYMYRFLSLVHKPQTSQKSLSQQAVFFWFGWP